MCWSPNCCSHTESRRIAAVLTGVGESTGSGAPAAADSSPGPEAPVDLVSAGSGAEPAFAALAARSSAAAAARSSSCCHCRSSYCCLSSEWMRWFHCRRSVHALRSLAAAAV